MFFFIYLPVGKCPILRVWGLVTGSSQMSSSGCMDAVQIVATGSILLAKIYVVYMNVMQKSIWEAIFGVNKEWAKCCGSEIRPFLTPSGPREPVRKTAGPGLKSCRIHNTVLAFHNKKGTFT
jgi:hypothetical protein